jgi:glycosyltransferase involved in cell wall biosynthesis
MEIKEPLVSIALCTYNGEAFLQEQLDTLVNQTYPNLEIIALDDRSTDGTLEILNTYQQKYPNFKVWVNEENLGYTKNFEKAISMCNGDYIALCDQDDIWELNKITLMIQNIGESVLIYHDSEFISQDGSSLNQKVSDLLNMYQGSLNTPFLFYNCVSGHAVLFKKILVDQLFPFKKGLFHDWFIAIMATENGGIKYLDKPLVKYRQHLSSNTDILRLKKEEKFSSKKSIYEINLNWLRFVLGRIKDNKLAIKIVSCFDKEDSLNFKNRTKLIIILIKNYKLLFFGKKKTAFSKLNYIRKIYLSNKQAVSSLNTK